MKLLGWMHRKFHQNANDSCFKNLSIGHQSVDEQQQLQYPHRVSNYYNKPLIKEYKDRTSLISPEQAAKIDQEDTAEIFHGFLAIGTFGIDPLATPTFSVSVENITEKETKVTEEELKIINEELEKVLAVDENSFNVSSGRNSYVSVGRSSHCSTITLSGGTNPRESTESKDIIVGGGAIAACPLQSYLLGSAVENNQEKKVHHRSSLGELFEKTKLADDDPKDYAFVGKKIEKESDKSSSASLLKKMLKKKTQYTDSSVSSEPKLHKILQIFNRKVHPESSKATKKSVKTWLGLKGSKAYQQTGEQVHSGLGEDIIIIQDCDSSYEKICKSQSNNHGDRSFGIATGEHWIKSDSDYLVLEL